MTGTGVLDLWNESHGIHLEYEEDICERIERKDEGRAELP